MASWHGLTRAGDEYTTGSTTSVVPVNRTRDRTLAVTVLKISSRAQLWTRLLGRDTNSTNCMADVYIVKIQYSAPYPFVLIFTTRINVSHLVPLSEYTKSMRET